MAPDNLPVRPTTDLAKESLFNILNNYFFFNKINVLDLFAGTGNLTYEFASREALSVTAVDVHQGCTDFIRKTIEKLDYQNVNIIRRDAFLFTEKCRQPFNVIFADPPYDLEGIERIIDNVFKNNLLTSSGWLVMEHSKKYNFENHPNFFEHRTYGKVHFTFFVNFEN